MTLSDLAIRRPVLATVVSLLIVVFGLASLQQLPIRELPDVDRAVVTVTTTYTGAAPEIIDTDITEVIEGAVAGIAGIQSIGSQSRRGRGQTTITFTTDRDIDEATNDVRDAVGRVRANLPADADEPRIVKSDADADPIMRIAITSDRWNAAEITDYAERFLVDRLATVDGVASVDVFGQRRFAIRIWLDRRAMAARNLTVADVEAALRRSNVELPAGEVRGLDRQFTVRLDGRLQDVDAFRNLIVTRTGDFPIRLGDIARVELGVADDQNRVRANGLESVGLGVIRQSQSNTVAISNAVRAEIERLRPTLPEGMEISIGSDEAIFIAASIREVLTALGISLVLVVAVIFVFLASWRATLVPAVTIPVALIGSFMLIYALGFSINTLTLLAMLLAIGLVVDDAIVVLENIQRRIEGGESPLVAAFLGTRQVTFAIIATSLTLIAVFVPISFMEGEAGRLFVEFGFVMAAAVIISTFVALTLCAVLAANLLSGREATGPAAKALDRATEVIQRGYRRLLALALAAPLPVLVICLMVAGGAGLAFQNLPRELTPREDRAVVFVPLSTPQGSTADYTDGQARAVEALTQGLVEEGVIETVFTIVGSGGRPDRAFIVMRLAPWGERTKTHVNVVAELAPGLREIPGARGFPVTPAGLGLRGSSAPLRVVVGGPDYDQVAEWANALVAAAEDNPGLLNLEVDFERNLPQLSIDIDRERADDLGIDIQTVAATLQTMLASREVTNWVDRGREYPVLIQAQLDDRRTPTDLANIFVRAGDGQTLVPLNALVTVREQAAAPELRRYDRLPSVTLTSSLADGYDLGSAIDYMVELAGTTLPPEAQIAFAGQSRVFLESAGGMTITFVLALVIVFLVLAAQFESFVDPLVIMLSVPLALAGAVYALLWTGVSLNLYSQIGIVLLIGLMAKNGILIVEFANQLRDEGQSVRDAVLNAAVLRLRPIVMTVVSTILGAVPLVLASGAGAESRLAIGTVIIGGLALAVVLTLFLTPVLYDLMARFTKPRGAVSRALEAELARARRHQPAAGGD
ncbi:MAG: efflux RND transporter permease subunit [Geminicoccaceae bacterium]|nr:MAG: efflux RND transporter permease subunit [Geminicoccaceae bacterium]